MDESIARRIADESIRAHSVGRVECLGARWHGPHSRCDSARELYENGKLKLCQEVFETWLRHLESRLIRPFWSVGYLAHGKSYKVGIGYLSVEVDDETGEAVLRDPMTE